MRPQNSSITLLQFTLGYGLALMVGWTLYIGQSVIIPIVIGVILLYVLVASSEALRHVPGLGHVSQGWRQVLVLLLFLVILFLLGQFVASNAQAISEAIPGYAENFNTLVGRFSTILGVELPQDWMQNLRDWLNQLDLSNILQSAVSGLTGVGAVLVTAVLYTVFLLSDLDDMPRKAERAFGDHEKAGNAIEIVARINQRVGGYLAAKTLVNVMLAGISFAVMWLMGIEFALFWAILIGLLNYIPYIGSVIGVAFPVVLAALQFGTVSQTLIALVLLMGAQMVVAYWLEPKMLGRSSNMSAFMVLVSLAVWGAIWGSVGAILAVPLTSVVMILLAEFPATRPIAVMMSNDGEVT